MATEHQYRVTRRGEDIYVGDEEGLLETAREGNVLANDLIFDPIAQKWVFARTLTLLTGFALRGKRTAGRELAEREQGARFTERTLARRAAKKRTLVRTAITLFLAVLTIVLVVLIPVSTPKPKAMSQFLEEPTFIPKDDDGDGVTPSRLARKGKTTKGKRSALLVLPEGAGDGEGGEGPKGSGKAGEGSSSGSAKGSGDKGQKEKGDGADSNGSQNGAKGEAPKGQNGTEGSKKPGQSVKGHKSAPPAKLLQDYRDQGRPGMLDQPIRSERSRYAARYMAEAMRTLNEEEPPKGDARLRQLLSARNKALFARDNLTALGEDKDQVANTGKLIEEIEIAYLAVCGPAHEMRFCELKLDHPDWSDSAVRQIADERIVVGMSEAQVRAAWGAPKKVKIDTGGRKLCYGIRCARWVATIGSTVVEIKE